MEDFCFNFQWEIVGFCEEDFAFFIGFFDGESAFVIGLCCAQKVAAIIVGGDLGLCYGVTGLSVGQRAGDFDWSFWRCYNFQTGSYFEIQVVGEDFFIKFNRCDVAINDLSNLSAAAFFVWLKEFSA